MMKQNSRLMIRNGDQLSNKTVPKTRLQTDFAGQSEAYQWSPHGYSFVLQTKLSTLSKVGWNYAPSISLYMWLSAQGCILFPYLETIQFIDFFSKQHTPRLSELIVSPVYLLVAWFWSRDSSSTGEMGLYESRSNLGEGKAREPLFKFQTNEVVKKPYYKCDYSLSALSFFSSLSFCRTTWM